MDCEQKREMSQWEALGFVKQQRAEEQLYLLDANENQKIIRRQKQQYSNSLKRKTEDEGTNVSEVSRQFMEESWVEKLEDAAVVPLATWNDWYVCIFERPVTVL